jgi:HEAT repeat protein
MLGADALAARDRLATSMRDDPLPQNRVAAAEAVARLAPSPEAVGLLADLLDRSPSIPVRLQAINALTFLGEQARVALPAIERAANGEQEHLRSAGRYLQAVLEGRYDPSFPVTDLEWLRKRYSGA